MSNPESQWFGFQSVNPDQKTSLVRSVFDSVADRYDIMNDLMSGGVHRLWKDRFIREIRPKSHEKFLDVAGGTGDIAFRLHKKAKPETPITVFDLNESMLSVGRDRALNQGWINEFDWVTGNAENLPFPDESFDIYTIAFGLRNITHIDTALKEAFRVLKPGGRFFCLEFSKVRNPVLAKIYDVYSDTFIPNVGKMVTGDRESYQYLVDSIRQFPSQEQLENRLQTAGFSHTRHTDLTHGVVSIHRGLRTL